MHDDVWPWDDPPANEESIGGVSAAWPPKGAEAKALRAGIAPHPFEAAEWASGFACTRLVERDGAGEDCGLPSYDPIHRASDASPFEPPITEPVGLAPITAAVAAAAQAKYAEAHPGPVPEIDWAGFAATEARRWLAEAKLAEIRGLLEGARFIRTSGFGRQLAAILNDERTP